MSHGVDSKYLCLTWSTWCLDRFIKTVNVSSFYDNVGRYIHQSNDMVREFHLHLSDSKLQNASTTTAHIYTLLARMFEEKQNSCFDVKGPWWVFFNGVSSFSELCPARNVDALLYDVTGLDGIYLLPESYLSSEKIIISFCAIRTRSSSLIESIRTRSYYLI